ncbi:MAG TPA: AAA family ATPase, partial [Candidatus Paceibacterota bacterium]
DDKALIRVDMSEFMEKHSVSKLIGAPPGYIGHDEGGNLTELIRHRPYSVILFDEIEKAHPEVFNILLQVLDNGRLTDSKGRIVNFKNSVIIMTSNIGAQFIEKMEKIGFAIEKTIEGNIENNNNIEKANYNEAKVKVMNSLKDYFRPEFLNRLDDIILFDILDMASIEKIVKIQVDTVIERLREKEIHLNISSEVLSYLAKEGYNPHYGARPLKRLIQNKILTPVAGLMISQGISKGGTIYVGIKKGSKDEFTFDVKNKKKSESPIIMKDMEAYK